MPIWEYLDPEEECRLFQPVTSAGEEVMDPGVGALITAQEVSTTGAGFQRVRSHPSIVFSLVIACHGCGWLGHRYDSWVALGFWCGCLGKSLRQH